MIVCRANVWKVREGLVTPSSLAPYIAPVLTAHENFSFVEVGHAITASITDAIPPEQ